MSYYVTCEGSDIQMAHQQVPLAMDALKKKFPKLFPPHLPELNFQGFCKNLFDFDVEFDSEGNVTNMYFEYNPWGGNDEFFEAIAPYVKAGSTFYGKGEDDYRWCTYFDGLECHDYPGDTFYPGLPAFNQSPEEAIIAAARLPYAIREYIGTMLTTEFANSLPIALVRSIADDCMSVHAEPYYTPDIRLAVTKFFAELLAQMNAQFSQSLSALLEE